MNGWGAIYAYVVLSDQKGQESEGVPGGGQGGGISGAVQHLFKRKEMFLNGVSIITYCCGGCRCREVVRVEFLIRYEVTDTLRLELVSGKSGISKLRQAYGVFF